MAKIRYDDRGNPYRKERIGGQLKEVYLDPQNPRGSVRLSIRGLEETQNTLINLGASINGIFRIAARRSATRVKNDLKQLLPTRGYRSIHNGKRVLTYGLSGQLRKSIDTRVLTSRGGIVHGIVGPSRQSVGFAFKKWHKPNRNTKAEKNQMVRVKPSLYWHLFEKGFTAKLWRSGRMKAVAGKHLLPRVLTANQAQIERDTADVFDEQLNKIVNRRSALIGQL